MIRFPAPLRPGDRIGVTSPSSGVAGAATRRIDFCVDWLRRRGYDVVVGDCMDGASHVSAPKAARAAELTAMLTDPAIRAVVPPWGGETAIDLLDQIDWDAIAAAEPTWLVGWSDLSTVMLPLTLRTGIATLHGDNLADTPYAVPEGLTHWLDIAGATEPVTQRDSGLVADWVRFEDDPAATEWTHVGAGEWTLHAPAEHTESHLEATGRLVGGCLDTVSALVGTPYGDVPGFAREHCPEGTLVYLEACEDEAFSVCRQLHGLRYAGWFDDATAILIGRTRAPDSTTMTQREAVLDALGDLDLPIVFDLEFGHVPPRLPFVNGALATIEVGPDVRRITQEMR